MPGRARILIALPLLIALLRDIAHVDVELFVEDAAEDIAGTGQAGPLDLTRGIPQPGAQRRLGTLEVATVDADAQHAAWQLALGTATSHFAIFSRKHPGLPGSSESVSLDTHEAVLHLRAPSTSSSGIPQVPHFISITDMSAGSVLR